MTFTAYTEQQVFTYFLCGKTFEFYIMLYSINYYNISINIDPSKYTFIVDSLRSSAQGFPITVYNKDK